MKFTTTAVQDIRLAQTCCAPRNEVREYLCGIKMKSINGSYGEMEIVGTDGHRLTKSEIHLTDQESMPENHVIVRIEGYIPTATNGMTFNINPRVDGGELCGKVELYKSFSQNPFKVLDLRLFLGNYPDWRKVVQHQFNDLRTSVVFNPTYLAEMTEAVGSKGGLCRLSFSDNICRAMMVEIYNYTVANRPDRVVRLMPGRYGN
jgi:hypothetical protein